MARGTTHYQVLGLPRDASSIDIAHAFREKLAEAQSRGADERVEAIRVAYQVLANPATRSQYDAELPPDPRQKRAQARLERGPSPLMEIVREAPGAWKIGVPVAVLFVGIILFKVWPRHAPPPAMVQASQKVAEPRSEAEVVAAVKEQYEKRPTVARPMTPEEIFAAVSPSVASITAEVPGGQSQGSGVVTGGGVVITNCHVVNDASSIRVKVAGETYGAAVRIADRELDLCSLNVTGLNAPVVNMPTFDAKVGQRVYAIGAPQGLELTLSEGLISALRETTKGAIIQTTAPISPGSSGGGLFNSSAQLVGIVTFQHKTGQNLNFALPVAWISEMRDRGGSGSSTGMSAAPGEPQTGLMAR